MYIRHLINTRNGRIIVDFKEVVCQTCSICKKEIPRIYYGKDPASKYAVDAIYKYTIADIIEEQSSFRKSLLPKECKKEGCSDYKYY